MNFLPEDDLEYLESKGIKYELVTETLTDGTQRRAVVFPAFAFEGNLRRENDSQWIECRTCDLMIIIPAGYATTKLDCFYSNPRLKRQDSADPASTGAENELFGRKWQFWSRHLDDKEWRVGIDGLSTYLSYVRRELRSA